MKIDINLFFIASLMFIFSSCNSGSHSDDGGIVGLDSSTWAPKDSELLEDDYRFDDVLIVDGTIDLESFQNKFSTYFDHQFDFG
jgi:hypothetical protein